MSLFLSSRSWSCVRRLGRWPKGWRASFHSNSKTNRRSPRQQRHPETRTTSDVLRTFDVDSRASIAGPALTERERQHAAKRIDEPPRAARHQHPVGDGVTLSGASVRVGAAAGGDSAGVCARVAAAPAGDGAGSQRLHRWSHCTHAWQTERTASVIATEFRQMLLSCITDYIHGLQVQEPLRSTGLHCWLLYFLIVLCRFSVVIF